MVALRTAPRLADLLQEVAAGHPVIVLQNLGLEWIPVWHYSVVIGYDLSRGQLVLRSGLAVPITSAESAAAATKIAAIPVMPTGAVANAMHHPTHAQQCDHEACQPGQHGNENNIQQCPDD